MTARDSLPDLFGAPPKVADRTIERDWSTRLGGSVAGVDEAGRGPLAGPVVTAAVILTDAPLPDGLTDSKAMTERARETAFAAIVRDHVVAVATASAARIDAMNVLAANLWAMARAVEALAERPAGVLVDGRDVPPGLAALGLPGRAIVKGDARVAAIAAASVVAKVTRDRIMRAADGAWPGYGFARHKGYGTAAHLEALVRLGPSPLHRMSFAPVRTAADAAGRR